MTGAMFTVPLALAGWVAALFLGISHCVAAPSSAAGSPARLPKVVIPVRYTIELKPDLTTSLMPGSEVVDVDVLEPTSRIILNAVNMTIDVAVLEGEPGQTAAVTFNAAEETATLSFSRELRAGHHRLRISFIAHINTFAAGIFSVDYAASSRMIATHLEPSYARLVFPCWDEPEFKAIIEAVVIIPQSLGAVSNMPVMEEVPLGSGLTRVSFAPTPRMSTYLFVLIVGKLEHLSANAHGVTISVVTTAGKHEQGRYALESAVKILGYYEEYFGSAFPLPKLDLIAVPGGLDGAMENWGAIVFFESHLLADEASSSEYTRRGIFSIIAHEMAHQWFGDLVTMAWWDDLWLNEGLANWLQFKAVEHFHPDWKSWPNTIGEKQRAMRLDALKTAHPIQQPVADPSEAIIAFDAITYSKTQAVIRMIEQFVGEDTFQRGIRRYIDEHVFDVATTRDFWHAMQSVSDKPVGSIADDFIRQSGVPLIISKSTCMQNHQRLALSQQRFTIHDRDAYSERWRVPIVLASKKAKPQEVLLPIDGTTEVIVGPCDVPVKLNFGDTGYYLVQYDAGTQRALTRSIMDFAPVDRANELADTWALVEAGRTPPSKFVELVEALRNDSNPVVWDEIISALTRIDDLERDRPGRAMFRTYARSRLHAELERLGWDSAPNETNDNQLLRQDLIRALGDLGDKEVLAEARRRFLEFFKNPSAAQGPPRDPIIYLAGLSADRGVYNALRALGRQSTNMAERRRYYSALASALDPALARETLGIALTDELPMTLRSNLITWVAWWGEHPELALAFLDAHFAQLSVTLGPTFQDYFVPDFMSNFTDLGHTVWLERFAAPNQSSGARIASSRAEESIAANADFCARLLPDLNEAITRVMTRP
jgi:aminopeptidase N